MDKIPTRIPVSLYIYWIILIIIFVLVLSSFLYRRRYHAEFFHDKPVMQFSFYMILIVLGFGLYFLEQIPPLFGYFDFKDMKFIHGYEEDTFVGFIRFVYKAAVGIFLLIYGLLGMRSGHEKEHH